VLLYLTENFSVPYHFGAARFVMIELYKALLTVLCFKVGKVFRNDMSMYVYFQLTGINVFTSLRVIPSRYHSFCRYAFLRRHRTYSLSAAAAPQYCRVENIPRKAYFRNFRKTTSSHPFLRLSFFFQLQFLWILQISEANAVSSEVGNTYLRLSN